MRRVRRLDLEAGVQADLDARQAALDRRRAEAILDVQNEWRTARQTNALAPVLVTLRRMIGDRQRCMYCLDSHGTDIEHFWPKTTYPERMFVWLNLLLCCTECGRFKGDQFPLLDARPLLVNPTTEDPWLDLDFDPRTGNIVARFNPDTGGYSEKGAKTVDVLHLDRREALATGCQRTFRRLVRAVEEALNQAAPSAEALLAALREADEHGLLGWCFCASGQNETPFRDLRARHPTLWDACVKAVREI
jgi:uncharacterized protein (TIGR02646 family)